MNDVFAEDIPACQEILRTIPEDDKLRRARFNASVITARESEPGERFEDIPELYIIYISKFDFLKDGLTVYHVD